MPDSDRIDALERKARGIPSRWVQQARKYPTFLIKGGNLLYTVGAYNAYGIKSLTGAGLTSVPTAVPSLVNTHPDGLGYGYFFGTTTNPVWVATKVRISGVDYSDFNSSLHDQFVTCRVAYMLPTDAGGTAQVWLPWIP